MTIAHPVHLFNVVLDDGEIDIVTTSAARAIEVAEERQPGGTVLAVKRVMWNVVVDEKIVLTDGDGQ